MRDPRSAFTEVLRHGDDNLVLAQRLAGWVASAPDLETDIALANIALDHLGVARALLARAGELEGRGRSEDDLAMLRSEREFTNLLLCELPNGDFAQTITRHFLFDAYQLCLWEILSTHPDGTLAGVAAKAIMEARYHFRFSSSWVIRLGDGTGESHRRMATAIGEVWRFVDEMFDDHPDLRTSWGRLVEPVLAEATLEKPSHVSQRRGGRQGLHTEHLGHMLAEMQSVARSYPGSAW
ncbi:MAG TPA: 1,2-phenylacetyl-CoA epoxidase subunit PaaC [Acidimicrobiia bacterium]|nr:1,2-phenylacetyl-CoA epoxidase subunit PaaC [Acidimicrobiia bacterium]